MAQAKVDPLSFRGVFERPSADLSNPDHITSRSSLSFDIHERLYCTLGEVCKVFDVDDTLVESFTSSDGLPFIAVEAPHLSTHRQVQGRFVCATTKGVHVYRQPSPDQDDTNTPGVRTAIAHNSPQRKVSLTSIEVVGAVPMSQRVLSMALFGPDQEHVVLLTTHDDGCIFVYEDLIRQAGMHEGEPDERWGIRSDLGKPFVVCGSAVSKDVVLINTDLRAFICYDSKGQKLATWCKYDKDVSVTAATIDSGNRLNVAFQSVLVDGTRSMTNRVDVYGTTGVGDKNVFKLLWRFNDDGLASFGIPVSLCVGGANNLAVLDDRDIPFPNIISWDAKLVTEKLKDLKRVETDQQSTMFSDTKYGFRSLSDQIIFPKGSYGKPLKKRTDPLKFVDEWKAGSLRARKKDSTSYVIVPGVIRLRTVSTYGDQPGQNKTRSPFSPCDTNDQLSCVPLSISLSFRLVRDDGMTTQWRHTKYIRPEAEQNLADAVFNFSDVGHISFDEDEIVDADGFCIQIEVKGRSGMNSGILGTLQLPGTNVLTSPPEPMERQQYDFAETMNVTWHESMLDVDHTITALVDIYIEPNILSIQRASEMEEEDYQYYEKDETNNDAGKEEESNNTTNTKLMESEKDEEEQEEEPNIELTMMNRKDHAVTTSSKMAGINIGIIKPMLEEEMEVEVAGNRRDGKEENENIKTSMETHNYESFTANNMSTTALDTVSKTNFVLPPSPREREGEVSEEILTIRELLSHITSSDGPERKGLVWRVGSTGGTKMRAYMSLRTMCHATSKLKTLIGREMAGHPIEMMLSDLSSNVKRIRCASALLLLALCDGHRANQRLLRRQPGFTIQYQHHQKQRMCRVFWAPLQLRSEYLANVTRKNQAATAWNDEMNSNKSSSNNNNNGGRPPSSPLRRRRRKIEIPSEAGFMTYCKRMLSAGVHLDSREQMTENESIEREENLERVRTVEERVDTPTMLFNREKEVKKAEIEAVDDIDGVGGVQIDEIDEVIVVTGSNKAFAHAFPSRFATYPAARMYRRPMKSGDAQWVHSDNGNNDEGNDDGSDEVVDVDSTLLDWCPDPLNHLLSFFLLPETQNVSDIDNIQDMVDGARLRTTFDLLGRGQAVPVIPVERLRNEPMLRAMLSETVVDSMCLFFTRQREKEEVTWGDVCEWRRYDKFTDLTRRQSEVEASLFSKPILMKKLFKQRIRREKEATSNAADNISGDYSDDMETEYDMELLTNIAVWVDTKNQRLRIDVTLHPSDGSKYRAYVSAPQSVTSSTTKSPKVQAVSSLLTLPTHTLETVAQRVTLPATHAVSGRVEDGEETRDDSLPSKSILKERQNFHPFKSIAPIRLLQIKLGGSSLRPKALLAKHKTLRKVLRTSLVLGKSLWQQARVQDAHALMSHAIVRAIECVPTRGKRTKSEDVVRSDLFRAAKRAKLVGRRDPAMAVMLIRSVFSSSLLRLLGKSIDEEIDFEKPLSKSKAKGTRKIDLQRNLNDEIFQSNLRLVAEEEDQKRVALEAKKKKMNNMTERRARVREEERKRRQQERIDLRRAEAMEREERVEKEEKDEDRWYAEGKRLEEVRMAMERKEREEKKKETDALKKYKQEKALLKRKTVEAARVKSIEEKARRKSKSVKIDQGIKDGRDVDWGRRTRGYGSR